MSKFRAPAHRRSITPKKIDAGSSIRGKISAPIPIDDDEFPIRSPGSGIATPVGSNRIDDQLHSRESGIPRSESEPVSSSSAVMQFEEPTGADRPMSPPQRSYKSSFEPLYPQTARSSAPVAQQDSMRSMPVETSEVKPQRKKSSGLRSVFGKLFGKKGKVAPEIHNGQRAGQHRSNPPALNKNLKGNVLTQQRSASLPVNELNRALRSHATANTSPVTEAVELNGESIRDSGYIRSRRATTPSRLWTPNRTPGYVDNFTGLSPRPASSQVKASHAVDSGAPIGVAVTSGSHPNRRSRSLGELRANTPKLLARRRSDEIRYWRESYNPGLRSPMSSNRADADDPIIFDYPEQRDDQPEPQPFNFGPMGEMAGMKITQAASLESRVHRLERRVHEIERVLVFTKKHHQASKEPLKLSDPPRRSSRRREAPETGPRTELSEPFLETPERYPRRPATSSYDIPPPALEIYRGIEQTNSLQARTNQVRSSSYGSSRPATSSTHNSYHPSFDNTSHPFVSSPDTTDFGSSQTTARAISATTTIRDRPSTSPTPKDGGLTQEHYATLLGMILAEQAARQHLESMVRTLQFQLQELSSKVPNTTSTSDDEQEDFDQEQESNNEDFRTPISEAPFGDDIFGTAPIEKTAPRTMSLSQMTHLPSVNF